MTEPEYSQAVQYASSPALSSHAAGENIPSVNIMPHVPMHFPNTAPVRRPLTKSSTDIVFCRTDCHRQAPVHSGRTLPSMLPILRSKPFAIPHLYRTGSAPRNRHSTGPIPRSLSFPRHVLLLPCSSPSGITNRTVTRRSWPVQIF